MRNTPCSFVAAERVTFVSTWVAVTVAPGTTPTLSTTVPVEDGTACGLRKRGRRACQQDQNKS